MGVGRVNYQEIIERRRALRIPGYVTLAEVGFDGPYVTPYQMSACSPDGPVLVAQDWLDAPSVEANRATLKLRGYLPGIPFNEVLDRALLLAGLTREQVYITQTFHLLPTTRSGNIKAHDFELSFDAVTRHELVGRRVVAMGGPAIRACSRHKIPHSPVCHPSARGRTYDSRATEIAQGLIAAR